MQHTQPKVPRTPTIGSGRLWCFIAIATIITSGLAVAAEETTGTDSVKETANVASLPPAGDHWLWVPDRLFQHSLLFDGDTGHVLGMLDSGQWLTPQAPLLARSRNEIYSVDVTYARGRRGDRLDFVTIYDAHTFEPTGEVIIPTKSAESNTSLAYAELLDNDHFLATFNQFPNASISITDVEARRYVGENIITGCAGIYPTGEKSLATLCGDGTVSELILDDAGNKRALRRSERFFDVVKDPVVMSAARNGTSWLFLTYLGDLTEIEFGAGQPKVGDHWSLVGESDRKEGWRPGGLQFVALHQASQRLFVVMHRGGPGSHKQAGSEIWVFDLERQERIGRFAAPNLTAAFIGPFLDIEEGSFADRALTWLIPNQGIHSLVVTQDEHPLLFARNAELGAIAVLDVQTGDTLRTLREAGVAGPTMRVP